MSGKHYIEKLLDLLVEMANHCEHKDTPVEGKAKCIDCALAWNFSIRDCGCLLVNILNNDDLIGDIMCVCEANNIDNYKHKLNKIANIIDTNY